MTRPLSKPPVLFLGAGASAAAFSPAPGSPHLPTVTQFFGKVHFPQRQDAKGFEAACQHLAWEIDVAERTKESNNWPVYDAEKLFGYLESLVTIERFHQQPISIPVSKGQAGARSPHVAVRDLLDFLKQEIVRVYGRDFPQVIDNNYLELFRLLDPKTPENQPILIFTTNYDTVMETQILNQKFAGKAFHARPKLCTGFSPGNPAKWQPQIFNEQPAHGERLIQLFKLHGSVSWKWDSSSGMRLPVEMGWREPTGDKDCLIYFGYKSVPEADPFKTLHDRLKDALLNSELLLAIGFRFFDPYIRETFDMALRANHQLRILCCLRSDPDSGTPLAKLIQSFPDRIAVLRDSNGAPLPFGQSGFLEVLDSALHF